MIVESLSNGVVSIVFSGDEHLIEINDNAVNIEITSDHSQLDNLDFFDSGHTGFEPVRGLNQNYVTDDQLTIIDNTSGINTGDQDLSNLQTKIIQIPGITLTAANWTLSGEYYEYDLSNANILATSIVDVIPDDADISIVKTAEILPKIVSSAGSVKIKSINLPNANIGVTINIF